MRKAPTVWWPACRQYAARSAVSWEQWFSTQFHSLIPLWNVAVGQFFCFIECRERKEARAYKVITVAKSSVRYLQICLVGGCCRNGGLDFLVDIRTRYEDALKQIWFLFRPANVQGQSFKVWKQLNISRVGTVGPIYIQRN
jgi:hypothetical protein